MPPIYRDATEQEIQAWEAKLAQGIAPDVAAADLQITLSSIRRADQERHAKGLDMSRERRRAKVDRRVDELVQRDEPSPGIVTAWAKANHDGYADKSQLEITAKVEHEHRGVFAIGDLARAAEKMGLLEQLGFARTAEALPAAVEVPARRSEDAVDQPGDLPPAQPA